MKKALYPAILILMTALSYLAGGWTKEGPATATAAGGRRILYYHDPMHPAYKSDKPGIAPDCGMQLEPVYADENGEELESTEPSLPPGTLQVSPEKQQLIGVQTAVVEKTPVTETLRTLGRVAADETRVMGVSAADGWVEEVTSNSTGSLVHKGDLLGKVYGDQFQTAQVALFFALQRLGRVPKELAEPDKLLYSQYMLAKRELQALGMSEQQITEISNTRIAVADVDLRAPITGFILSRNIVPGMRCNPQSDLFRIADLSRIWIVTDLYENEARYFVPGAVAQVALPAAGGTMQAKVSDVLPEFDPATRTLKVRLEMDNPGFKLRPDMFVDVHLPVTVPPTLTVPAEAVLDSGIRKTVFVDRGNGYFETREVETGSRIGGRVEIMKGLDEGERIVVAGNFLLDSESRLKAAAQGIPDNAVQDPVCGMKINPAKAHDSVTRDGVTYYFCSADCEEKFNANPDSFVAKPKMPEGKPMPAMNAPMK